MYKLCVTIACLAFTKAIISSSTSGSPVKVKPSITAAFDLKIDRICDVMQLSFVERKSGRGCVHSYEFVGGRGAAEELKCEGFSEKL